MKLDLHYTDPRLVELYDRDNPLGIDSEFYLRLADELEAKTIVDLGCGTGLLTRQLAQQGLPERTVIGVDPAAEMLAFGRRQPGAERVLWIEGDSGAIGEVRADLAIMTGNVAQVFLDDEAWADTLQHLHASLRPGGVLAFETRNPAYRAWEQWNRANSYQKTDTPFGPLEEWLDVTEVADGRVCFEATNVFSDTGDVLVVKSELRFRTYDEVTASLQSADFTVNNVFGNWQRKPFAESDPPMIFVAQRR